MFERRRFEDQGNADHRSQSLPSMENIADRTLPHGETRQLGISGCAHFVRLDEIRGYVQNNEAILESVYPNSPPSQPEQVVMATLGDNANVRCEVRLFELEAIPIPTSAYQPHTQTTPSAATSKVTKVSHESPAPSVLEPEFLAAEDDDPREAPEASANGRSAEQSLPALMQGTTAAGNSLQSIRSLTDAEPSIVGSEDSMVPSREIQLLGPKDTDIRSVVSDDIDIESQASPERDHRIMFAENYFANFLSRDTDLHLLCKHAMQKISKQRLQRNLRRLLKSYYIRIRPKAQSFVEKGSVALLRWRISRKGIVRRLLATIAPQSEETASLIVEEVASARTRIENWLKLNAQARSTEHPPESRSSTDESDDDSSENSSADSVDEAIESASIAQAEYFLKSDRPFRELLSGVQIFLLPASLTYLTRTLMTLPSNCVSFHEAFHPSRVDVLKAFLESLSGTVWN